MTNIEEYNPTARKLVFSLSSEYKWLELLKNNGKEYEPILDYLIDLGKRYEQDIDIDNCKKYQSKTISTITGINSLKIKKLLEDIYNDIFKMNYSNPELFKNDGKYLYDLCFSNLSYFSHFYVWFSVMLNPFNSFDFSFINAKVDNSTFWVHSVNHYHEYGKRVVRAYLYGGYSNKYRELLFEKARFMKDISYKKMSEIFDYQSDEILIDYARREKL